MQIDFVTFALRKLGWNTEVVHSKELARTDKLTFVNLLYNLEEEWKWKTQKVGQ